MGDRYKFTGEPGRIFIDCGLAGSCGAFQTIKGAREWAQDYIADAQFRANGDSEHIRKLQDLLERTR